MSEIRRTVSSVLALVAAILFACGHPGESYDESIDSKPVIHMRLSKCKDPMTGKTGENGTSHPRTTGVAVPASLRGAGCPGPRETSGPVVRARAAARALEWLTGRFSALPEDVLRAELPSPSVILATWTVGSPTRLMLARTAPRSGEHRWCVADLQGTPGFTPQTLLDLLAAREEQPWQMVKEEPRPTTSLDALTAELERRMPCRAEELAEVLSAAGFTRTGGSAADEIARLYGDAQRPVPFRAIRRFGARLIIAPGDSSATLALIVEAAHFVSRAGLASVSAVVERVRSLRTQTVTSESAVRVLSLLPSFRWLSRESGWFSFAGALGRLSTALRKIFSITRAAPLEDLCLALAKGEQAFEQAPREVLQAYVSEILGCRVERGLVHAGTSLRPTAVTSVEVALASLLSLSPGGLPPDELRRRAAALGVDARTVRRFLSVSPLAIERAERVHLVGHGVPHPTGATSSRRRQVRFAVPLQV